MSTTSTTDEMLLQALHNRTALQLPFPICRPLLIPAYRLHVSSLESLCLATHFPLSQLLREAHALPLNPHSNTEVSCIVQQLAVHSKAPQVWEFGVERCHQFYEFILLGIKSALDLPSREHMVHAAYSLYRRKMELYTNVRVIRVPSLAFPNMLRRETSTDEQKRQTLPWLLQCNARLFLVF